MPRASLRLAGGLILTVLLTAPALGAGFAFDAQGSKAMGLASAFTAQADDPSALFYNPGGLAFFEKGATSVGTVLLRRNESQFQGGAPGIAVGTTGEQGVTTQPLGHAYLVKALRPGVRLGVGAYQPFHLDNAWADPDTFAGRTESLRSELDAFDLGSSLAVKVGKVGLGLGLVVRASELGHQRRLQRTDPSTGTPVDVADMVLETDMETGFGWSFGLLYRSGGRLDLGLSYRSAVSVDYTGSATLTQIETDNPQLDRLVASSFPLDEELALETSVEFPARASLGAALGLGARTVLELDVDWTEWSRLERLTFTLPNDPTFSQNLEQRFDDALAYRLGLVVSTRTGTEFRFGVAVEETPQPETTLGPFLPDAERNVLAVGIGKDWLDVALMYVEREERTTATNLAGINGTYRGNTLLLGITVTKK